MECMKGAVEDKDRLFILDTTKNCDQTRTFLRVCKEDRGEKKEDKGELLQRMTATKKREIKQRLREA